jgi:hypothetical protein
MYNYQELLKRHTSVALWYTVYIKARVIITSQQRSLTQKLCVLLLLHDPQLSPVTAALFLRRRRAVLRYFGLLVQFSTCAFHLSLAAVAAVVAWTSIVVGLLVKRVKPKRQQPLLLARAEQLMPPRQLLQVPPCQVLHSSGYQPQSCC